MYGKAWEKQDADLLLDCFTPNGVYQESPIGHTYKGHNAIRDFWNNTVVELAKNIKFTLKQCYISNDAETGFAEWECTAEYKCNNWKPGRAVGIMILKMKDGKILS